MNDNGELVRYGTKATDFLGDVLNDKARDFIGSTAEPFFLYLSTYTPHKPFATAPRHLSSHAGAVAPRTPAYNSFGENEPAWLSQFPQLSDWKLAELDKQLDFPGLLGGVSLAPRGPPTNVAQTL